MHRLLAVAVCGTFLCLASAQAIAQTAPPPSSSATTAPDVVRLKNGGLLRGTIAELVPGKQVTIVLVTGDRRTISMDEVQYAGAASEAPKPAEQAPAPPASTPAPSTATDNTVRPLVTVHAEEARLQLRANDPDTTFYVRTGLAAGSHGVAAAYDRICTAPCEASMPAGSYEMALSEHGGPPRGTSDAVVIRGESTLRGSVESRMGIRMVGLAIAIGGGIGGFYLTTQASSSHQECSSLGGSNYCHDVFDFDGGKFGAGLAISTASVTAGLLMMILIKDKAIITVSPGAPASGAAPRKDSIASGLTGLRVQGAF